MRHFVFMKFEPGYFDDNVYTYIRTNFSRLQAVMSEDILSCRVSKNCVERDRNMDMMIEMELKDAGSLPKYLNHPLHLAVGERMNCHVIERASFDCE
ncbi:MAG: Dabb family protein [Clostridiales bacterium]|nr:Dabb family protein [Clostridiales bacterium]